MATKSKRPARKSAKRSARGTAKRASAARAGSAKKRAGGAKRGAPKRAVKKSAKRASAKKVTRKKPAKRAAAKKAVAKKRVAKKSAAKPVKRAAAKKAAPVAVAKPPVAVAPKKPAAAAPAAKAALAPAAKPAAAPAKKPAAAAAPADPFRTFVWHDLMTANIPAAIAFYKSVFGWTIKEMPMPQGNYSLIHSAGRDMGGFMHFDKPGMGSYWVPYLEVENVDAICRAAKKLGANVHQQPTDIPTVGTFAIVGDPQGGVFAPIRFVTRMSSKAAKTPIGHVAWNELVTPDPAAAAKFYSDLLGWSVDVMPMGETTYRMFKMGDLQVAGCVQPPPGKDAPGMWLPYFAVADVDSAASRATREGAMMMMPPFDVPNIGRMAIFMDPWGAPFAAFKAASA